MLSGMTLMAGSKSHSCLAESAGLDCNGDDAAALQSTTLGREMLREQSRATDNASRTQTGKSPDRATEIVVCFRFELTDSPTETFGRQNFVVSLR